MKKKVLSLLLVCVFAFSLFAGCGSSSSDSSTTETETEEETSSEAMSGEIIVVSREDGSGTRGAFVELFEVEDEDGNDITTASAQITSSTGVMLTTIADNDYAIGYVSMGSLDDSVKALDIDGVEATVENVADGSYGVSRPFNIATYGEVSELAQDFIDFILSADGQAVIEDNGYIAVSDADAYSGSAPSGTITVGGSSSVSPVMEKLIEAYAEVNPNATIELQTSDSSTGMNSTAEGVLDIGMASRNLKDSEVEAGLEGTTIAMDGIAVIVSLNNTTEALTSEQVQGIYTGEITDWSELQ